MAKPQNVICPECGTWMVSRVNRQNGQRFWGCHLFPECKGTRDTGQSKAEREADRETLKWKAITGDPPRRSRRYE